MAVGNFGEFSAYCFCPLSHCFWDSNYISLNFWLGHYIPCVFYPFFLLCFSSILVLQHESGCFLLIYFPVSSAVPMAATSSWILRLQIKTGEDHSEQMKCWLCSGSLPSVGSWHCWRVPQLPRVFIQGLMTVMMMWISNCSEPGQSASQKTLSHKFPVLLFTKTPCGRRSRKPGDSREVSCQQG